MSSLPSRVGSDDTPTRPASSASGALTNSCAPTNTSTGPASTLAILTLTAAASAASGSALAVKGEIVAMSDGPRIVLRPSTSALELVRDDTVVAQATGPGDGPEVPLPLASGRTTPAQTLPDRLILVGRDGNRLPPGDYQLRGIVGYGSDPLNSAAGVGGGSFCLMSQPVDLKVI